MHERSIQKAAAIGGILFVLLLVIEIVLTIGAPTSDKSATQIVKWYADNRSVVLLGGALTGLWMVAFLAFVGYLHHLLSPFGGARRALASILLASGIATDTIAAVTVLPSLALAVTASRPGVAPSEGVVHTLSYLSAFSGVLVSVGTGLFLVVIGLLLADGALSPRWSVWVAYVGAGLSLIGGIVSVFVSKTGSPNIGGLVGLVGLALFLIVVMSVSIDLLRGRTPAAV